MSAVRWVLPVPVLVALTAFVGLTTSIFSRPYMRVERDHGKMTPPRLRLYHSMYQLFSFTMLLALTTNNMGILWVAMEAATLTTVLLVSVYRTAASLEAAWKYFILCGVGIAQALFGTVLLYMAAEKVVGPEAGALLWTNLEAAKAQLDPQIITVAFAFLFVRWFAPSLGPRVLRRYLQWCGGGFVKLGQVLAMRFDMLPPAYCGELLHLLDRVAPISTKRVRAIVAAELGARFADVVALEDELCDFDFDGLSSGASPDRLDALVWAVTELLERGRWQGPRITFV